MYKCYSTVCKLKQWMERWRRAFRMRYLCFNIIINTSNIESFAFILQASYIQKATSVKLKIRLSTNSTHV